MSILSILALCIGLVLSSNKNKTKITDYHYRLANYSRDTGRDQEMTIVMKLIEEERILCKIEGICPTVKPSIIGARTNCVNGNSGGYECSNVDMLSFVSLASLGSSSTADGNDIWGYMDSLGRAYALTGQTDGASIVDITDPVNPEVLVFIQSSLTQNTVWRDIKIYENMMFIVADRSGHGLQYVNIDAVVSAARNQASRPFRVTRGSSAYSTFVGTDTRFGNCHNIALNEDSGILYMVGSNQASGGLFMYDVKGVKSPADTPTLVGSFPNDGYTHDTECIIYNGPQTAYTGHEICFGYNENSLTIVDVTNKGSPQMLSRTPYNNVAYTHQGWITPDHKYVLLNDELDEQRFGINTRTLIWDVQSLTSPSHIGSYNGPTRAVDHNLYIKRNFVYEANYRAGLRVMDIQSIANAQLTEVAYFKTWSGTVTASFNGAWSNFPYYNGANFPQGIDSDKVVVVQDIEQGLFVFYVNPTNPPN